MDSARYFESVTKSDETLRHRQSEIRTAEKLGHVTLREAAEMRVAALSSHLTACREARERYLRNAGTAC